MDISRSWCVCMTLEAVNFDGCIFVTGDAEVTRVIHTDIFTILIFYRMTTDTLFKAVPGCPDALVHGLITLMKYVLHVISTHVFFRFDTLPFTSLYVW